MSKRPAAEIDHDFNDGQGNVDLGLNGQPGDAVGRGSNRQNKAARPADRKHSVIHYKDLESARIIEEYYQAPNKQCVIEVVILPDSLSKNNRRVKSRQIWGDVIYTPDSDIVAVLMHLGYYASNLAQPPPNVVEVRALIRVLPPQDSYSSKARFVKSRSWSSSNETCSYKVERCWLITRTGSTVELQPCMEEIPAPLPTLQPAGSDRQISTRSTSVGGKSKAAVEVSVQFNLCNEPWLKYSLAAIADRGLKPSQWTSARLHKEVLFLETNSERYQLSCNLGTNDSGNLKESFTFARCMKPLPLRLIQKAGIPLPESYLVVVASDLAWEDLAWGANSLHVNGKEYQLKRLHFMALGNSQH